MISPDSLSWLYLDFNSYFTTIEQQINPFLRKKPIVVVPSLTDYTCAIAASYEAKRLGIKTGTMIFEAKKICPKLICIEANHEKYIYYHHKLIREINKYIPIEIVCSIDEVACKLLENESDAKKITSIALNIKAGIRKNVGDYISCSIGISTNKFLAKTASNLKKPDGLKIIYKKDLPIKLMKLKLSDLTGIGKRMEERLLFSGITTVEQLYKLSPKNMRKIWGSVQGERFWNMLKGNEVPDIITNTNTVGHSHVLHPNWRSIHFSKKILKRLVLKASSRLRRKNFFCKKLCISIKTTCKKKIVGKKKFNKINDSFSLLEKADILWEELIHPYKKIKIKHLSIVLYDLELVNSPQINFFQFLDNDTEKSFRKKTKLSNTIDTINSRFGRDSITIGNLPNSISRFSGTKVAFTRIPDIREFYE